MVSKGSTEITCECVLQQNKPPPSQVSSLYKKSPGKQESRFQDSWGRPYQGPAHLLTAAVHGAVWSKYHTKALDNKQKQDVKWKGLDARRENSFFTALSLEEGHNSGPQGREEPRALVENQEFFWLQEPEDRVWGKHSHCKMQGVLERREPDRGNTKSEYNLCPDFWQTTVKDKIIERRPQLPLRHSSCN